MDRYDIGQCHFRREDSFEEGMLKWVSSSSCARKSVDHSSASDPRSCERRDGLSPISIHLPEMFYENRTTPNGLNLFWLAKTRGG